MHYPSTERDAAPLPTDDKTTITVPSAVQTGADGDSNDDDDDDDDNDDNVPEGVRIEIALDGQSMLTRCFD